MRPLRLSMQAFGPFAGKQELDFRELGRNRLFLIHGETGAGKSTILDGICAALYGESAGHERTPEQMRSDHAAPDVPTELEFDFAIGDATYRIHRVPEQLRPKKRGSGTTKMNASVVLRELSGPERGATEGTVLAERKTKDVLDKVVELIGLEASQFRQVVVLPQGQFRRLLTAESAERETILEKLFDTAAYLRIERKLLDEKKALRKQIGSAMERRQGKLATQEVDTPEALEAKIEGETRGLRFLEADATTKKADASRRAEELSAGRRVHERFGELDRARGKLEELLAKAEEITLTRLELSAAKEAAKLEAAFAKRGASVEAAETRRVEDATARKELEQETSAVDESRRRAKEAEAEHRKNRERRERLAEAKERVKALQAWSRRRDERVRAEIAAEDARARSEATKVAWENHLKTRHETEGRIAVLKSTEADRVRAEGEVGLAEERVARHVKLAATEKRLESATLDRAAKEQARREAKLAASAAKTALETLMATRAAGSAAVLAEGLEEGAPCPVCGSENHPRPARESEELPSEETLDTAAAANEAAGAKVVEAEGELGSALEKEKNLRAERDSQREALGGETSKRAEDSLKAAKATLEEARKRERERDDAAAALKKLDEAGATIERKAKEASADTTKAESALEAARNEEKKASEALEAGERDLEAVEARANGLASEIAAADEAHEAARKLKEDAEVRLATAGARAKKASEELAKAAKVRDEADTAWTEALADSPFEDEMAFVDARLEVRELEASARRLKAHDEALAAARGKLEEHDAALREAERPEIATLEAHDANARAAAEAVTEQVGRVKRSVDAAEKTLGEVRADQKETAELERRFSLVGGLADVATGENGARLSLHRFVLSAFLDDVLFTASEHLARMSRGRYRLARREVVADRRKKHGLDLNVTDHFTGQERPATTLSGGEGFLAALALALGLADVVQAHAGGIRLETVFVDEGFGSLDPETLDLAVGTLLELQKTGRLVGVISHVGELKERIDVRLEVEKTDQGSEARFRLPD